jgi:hypothetical protein
MKDKRRHRRAATAYPAAIVHLDDQSLQIECTVIDLSQRGARLSLDLTDVPDEFRLLIATNGLSRRCRVVWRQGNEIGVAFQNRFGN